MPWNNHDYAHPGPAYSHASGRSPTRRICSGRLGTEIFEIFFTRFFGEKFQKPDTKGVKCIEKNIDLIIARGGILINPKTWSII